MAAAPFPVYGLKREPLRLRLRSPGWGVKGGPTTVDRVHFGYVAGRSDHPEQAVEVTQGPAAHADIDELGAIESLVRNYAPEERREGYFYRGDIHQGRNLERVSLASRERTTILVGGMAAEIELASWLEPQRVTLGRLTLGKHLLMSASLGLSRPELLQALATVVVLQQDEEALAQHQRGYDEADQVLRSSHGGSGLA